MQVLIVVSYIFAAASAGVLAPLTYQTPLAYGHYAYAGPQHLPVIGPNGVPLDTPEVAAGKVANSVAHAEAHARNGDFAVVAPAAAPLSYAAHSVVSPLAYAHGHFAYAGPQHIPVIGPNGVPLDTPEVAAGKVANAVAHVEAKARNGDLAVVSPLAAPVATIAHAGPVAIANGVPLDTPEVAHAKAAHFAAHVDAKVRNGDLHAYGLPLVHYRKRRGIFGAAAITAPIAYSHGHLAYAGPQHLPVIGPNGVPLDTPEVAAGKIANAVAHAEAKARNGDLAVVAPAVAPLSYAAHSVVAPVAPIAPLAYSTPVAYAHGHYAYAGPQHIPVIGPNGVPLDTPEVAAGKVANAVAHVEAKARNGDLAVVAPAVAPLSYAAHSVVAPVAYAHGHLAYAGPQHLPVIGPNGVPLDTPEVAAGKVANAVAHAEAKARNGDLLHYY